MSKRFKIKCNLIIKLFRFWKCVLGIKIYRPITEDVKSYIWFNAWSIACENIACVKPCA
jgi:hypothetical protein